MIETVLYELEVCPWSYIIGLFRDRGPRCWIILFKIVWWNAKAGGLRSARLGFWSGAIRVEFGLGVARRGDSLAHVCGLHVFLCLLGGRVGGVQ